MGFGTSLFLIAVGAILRFAVSVSTHGFNIQTVGVILMIVGAVGFVVSLFWMAIAADRSGFGRRGDGAAPPPPPMRDTESRY